VLALHSAAIQNRPSGLFYSIKTCIKNTSINLAILFKTINYQQVIINQEFLMLSTQSRPYIDASVPVLRMHGLAITTEFYKTLFEAHPELNAMFNSGNQSNGTQQQSLAAAVFAYAANIDNYAALAPVITRIAHKHASVGVTAMHYPIVGQHLLAAIQAVLGDAATPELIAAWAEAYGLLAQTLTDEEHQLYAASGIKPGELLDMRVCAIEAQSMNVVSFVLKPIEGVTPAFKAGQYINVAIRLPSGLRQMRQYSLSDKPNGETLRVSVKRESGDAETPEGVVSNWLHQYLKVGDTVAVSPPFGDFTPDTQGSDSIMLLSGGIGITPMIATLNHIAQISPQRSVIFVHAANSAQQHSHRADISTALSVMPNLKVVTFYEQPQTDSGLINTLMNSHTGRLQVQQLPSWDVHNTAVYLCGPLPFMQAQWQALIDMGVPTSQLHREVFGPDLLHHLIS
jgi:nitric oxide dioxygenase